ncbi:MAG: hypothetical protein ONB44_04240 [candidate division KSB1 bacterium]|nr:hypothetical protein [candidate division KSB1 bacterium]MDZ7301341.1 hypothetical protein [candidate division KSB1 bacterium]MDZ7310774.1 hypothetical protein [candidate division KSB1 bacterium]
MNSKTLTFFVRCLVLVLMILPSVSFAGSFYSRHGIGLLRYRDGVKAIGMGGAGLAIADSISFYFLNPATMARVNFSRIQGDFLYERTNVTLQDGTGMFHDANVNSLGLAIPVKRGSVLAFGVRPYSRSDFEFSQRDSSNTYEEILRGTGGVNEVYFGITATWGAWRTGLTTDFYFGRINRIWRVNFASQEFNNTEDVTNNHVTGIGVHLGVQTQLGKWRLGGAAGLPTRLNVKTTLSTNTGFENETHTGKLKLPLWWGVGLGYAPNRHWLMGADWRTQQWSKVKPDEFLGVQGVDSYDLLCGVEATPSFDPLDGYFKRMSYRVGGAYRKLPYEEPAGKNLHEWTVSLGLGLPFSGGYNRIDLAVELGKRGSFSDNIAEENLVLVYLAIIGGERWFQRGPRR